MSKISAIKLILIGVMCVFLILQWSNIMKAAAVKPAENDLPMTLPSTLNDASDVETIVLNIEEPGVITIKGEEKEMTQAELSEYLKNAISDSDSNSKIVLQLILADEVNSEFVTETLGTILQSGIESVTFLESSTSSEEN